MKNTVIELLNALSKQSPISDIERLKKQIKLEIADCNNFQEIQQAIDADILDELPVLIKKIMLERLVALQRNSQNLRELAYYLLRHGPEWDSIANEMLQEAEWLEIKSS